MACIWKCAWVASVGASRCNHLTSSRHLRLWTEERAQRQAKRTTCYIRYRNSYVVVLQASISILIVRWDTVLWKSVFVSKLPIFSCPLRS